MNSSIKKYSNIDNFLFYNLLLSMFKHGLELQLLGVKGLTLTSIYLFYQQSGDAKKPFLAQYSAVTGDSPVRVS